MKKKKKGYTLVELIVVFALIALLGVTVASVIASYMNFHTRTRDLGQMEMVADMLLDDIQSNLSSGSGPTVYPAQTDGNNAISFRDRNQYVTIISMNYGTTNPTGIADYDAMYAQNTLTENDTAVEEGIDSILLYSYDKQKNDEAGSGNNLADSQRYSFWAYPVKSYMQNKVTGLVFEKVSQGASGKDNVYCVTLTMENTRSGAEYSEQRYMECYSG